MVHSNKGDLATRIRKEENTHRKVAPRPSEKMELLLNTMDGGLVAGGGGGGATGGISWHFQAANPFPRLLQLEAFGLRVLTDRPDCSLVH